MADNRIMEELLQAHTEQYGEAIVIPEINTDHFEIKMNLLQLVQANPFRGFERENPHTHINNFKRITSTLKFRDAPNDVIKLMVFSYSLEGAARVWRNQEMSQSLSRNVPDNSPKQEASMGHSIPRRLDSPTSQATQLPELELTLTPTTGSELFHEINNHSVPTLISQAPGPSRKRSRSPSSPFYPDATTFSDGKPASETAELNPEDVTARLEDIEVEIDTLHAETKDKELLISELQDSLAVAKNEILLL
ncbi:hypothetical protein Tco_0532661 [Tanacetum coccineum]